MQDSRSVRHPLPGVRDTGQPLEIVGDGAMPDARGAGELDLVVRDLARRMGAETGLLAVADQTEGFVEVLAAWSAAPGQSVAPRSVDGGFVGRVLESGHATVEPLDPGDAPSLGEAPSGKRLTYAAGAGVRRPGGPPGALCVGFSGELPGDLGLTLWLMESYARLAALCLYDEGALDWLLASARRDGLTGCLNYAAIRHELSREIRRSDRHGLTVSCCFIDLDHFKRVNDLHGHLHGNRVLANVATVLRDGVRTDDTLGRYGGDEFVALLPDTDEAAAGVLAERLRDRICSATRAEHDPIDASIGVAQWRPGSSPEQMLTHADGALHAAKAAGGGQVIRASELRPAMKLAAPTAETGISWTPERREVRFCAHCGQSCDGVDELRVCAKCGLGLLVSAPIGSAPTAEDPFLIVNANMTVAALSRRAEKVLGLSQRSAIHRQINEILIDDEFDAGIVEGFDALIASSAGGETASHELVLRPAGESNIRFAARVGTCGPPRAALIVLLGVC